MPTPTPRQRGGGGALRDPVVGIAAALAILPAVAALRLVIPTPLVTAFWVLAATTCGVAAFSPLRRLVRALTAAYQRSLALEHLPGPCYGMLGILPVLRRRKDIHRQVTEWAEQYGPIFRIRVVNFHAVVITDPILAALVLRDKVLDKVRFQYHFLDPFLGGVNVLTGPSDDHWRAVRKGVSPAFSAVRMREACRVVAECAMDLVAIIAAKPEQPRNVDNLLLRESMDVIGRIGFNKNMDALHAYETPGSEDKADLMVRATHEVMLRINEPYRVHKLWKAGVQAGHRLLHSFQDIIKDLLAHMKTTQPVAGSFAQLLMSTQDPCTKAALADKQMVPEISSLFFAGIDTTGHTASWILYLLSQHPHVEERLVQELNGLGLLATQARPQPRTVAPADLGQLTYLQAIIKEALRMYPPVGIGQIRTARQHDIVLAGKLHVPRGTLLWVPHHAMHNVSFNWDAPHRFQPERWLQPGTEFADPGRLMLPPDWYEAMGVSLSKSGMQQGEEGAGHSAKRYMPFAEGPRDCLGQNLAKTSLLATIATLMSHLHFDLADRMHGPAGVQASEQYTLVTGLSDGMWMTAKLRVPNCTQAHSSQSMSS